MMLLMKGKVEKLEAQVGMGIGRLKPDTTGSSHRGRPASDFSTFPFISNIIYIPSLHGGESSE